MSDITYYVSESGDNNNNGLSPTTPFRHPPGRMSSVDSGTTRANVDLLNTSNTYTILFKRGDVWANQEVMMCVDLLNTDIGTYGTGADPIWHVGEDILEASWSASGPTNHYYTARTDTDQFRLHMSPVSSSGGYSGTGTLGLAAPAGRPLLGANWVAANGANGWTLAQTGTSLKLWKKETSKPWLLAGSLNGSAGGWDNSYTEDETVSGFSEGTEATWPDENKWHHTGTDLYFSVAVGNTIDFSDPADLNDGVYEIPNLSTSNPWYFQEFEDGVEVNRIHIYSVGTPSGYWSEISEIRSNPTTFGTWGIWSSDSWTSAASDIGNVAARKYGNVIFIADCQNFTMKGLHIKGGNSNATFILNSNNSTKQNDAAAKLQSKNIEIQDCTFSGVSGENCLTIHGLHATEQMEDVFIHDCIIDRGTLASEDLYYDTGGGDNVYVAGGIKNLTMRRITSIGSTHTHLDLENNDTGYADMDGVYLEDWNILQGNASYGRPYQTDGTIGTVNNSTMQNVFIRRWNTYDSNCFVNSHTSGSNITIENCIFKINKSPWYGGHSAGLDIRGDNTIVAHNITVKNNHFLYSGEQGIIIKSSTAADHQGTHKIYNNIFYEWNQRGVGSIYCITDNRKSGTPNTLDVENNDQYQAGSNINAVWDDKTSTGYDTFTLANAISGFDNNIDNNPNFVNPSTTSTDIFSDFALNTGSALLKSGTTSGWSDGQFDANREALFLYSTGTGSKPDIGAIWTRQAGKTYYINPDIGLPGNDGTPSSPYRSILDIYDSINTNDTICLRRGTEDKLWSRTEYYTVNKSLYFIDLYGVTFTAYSNDTTGADDNTSLPKPIISRIVDLPLDSETWTSLGSDIWYTPITGNSYPEKLLINNIGQRSVDVYVDGGSLGQTNPDPLGDLDSDSDRIWWWGTEASGKGVYLYSTSNPSNVSIAQPGYDTTECTSPVVIKFRRCKDITLNNIEFHTGSVAFGNNVALDRITGFDVLNCNLYYQGANSKGISISGEINSLYNSYVGNTSYVKVHNCDIDTKNVPWEDSYVGNSGFNYWTFGGSDGINCAINVGIKDIKYSGAWIKDTTIRDFGHSNINLTASTNSDFSINTGNYDAIKIYNVIAEDIISTCQNRAYGRVFSMGNAEQCIYRRINADGAPVRSQISGKDNLVESCLVKNIYYRPWSHTNIQTAISGFGIDIINNSSYQYCEGNKFYNLTIENCMGAGIVLELQSSATVSTGVNEFKNIIFNNCGYGHGSDSYVEDTSIILRRNNSDGSVTLDTQDFDNIIIWSNETTLGNTDPYFNSPENWTLLQCSINDSTLYMNPANYANTAYYPGWENITAGSKYYVEYEISERISGGASVMIGGQPGVAGNSNGVHYGYITAAGNGVQDSNCYIVASSTSDQFTINYLIIREVEDLPIYVGRNNESKGSTPPDYSILSNTFDFNNLRNTDPNLINTSRHTLSGDFIKFGMKDVDNRAFSNPPTIGARGNGPRGKAKKRKAR